METAETPIIEVNHLDFFYGKSRALSNINMEIMPQVVTALIGPSGCGKSTFLRCLNRMNDTIHGTRVSGEIKFRGKNIYAEDTDLAELRYKIGMVFQKPNPFPQSVFANVAYGPRVLGVDLNKKEMEGVVEASLRQAGLWKEVKDRLNHNALSLNLGEQQRLCIARVLAVKPDIILMDEPASALDPIATSHIEELIEALKVDYTIVIVTHNMQQASRISDFTGLFWLGELVEFGETARIFTKPKQQLTEDYLTGKMG